MVKYGAETSPLQFSRVSFSKPSTCNRLFLANLSPPVLTSKFFKAIVDRVGAGEERMWGGGLYGRPPFCAPTARRPQGLPLLCYGLAYEGGVWISTHRRARTGDRVPENLFPFV